MGVIPSSVRGQDKQARCSMRRRGRRVSVTELRRYNRQLVAHDAEDARENLQHIRGGVLAGILRQPRKHDGGREVTEYKAFTRPLWTCADGSKALDSIGKLNYEGKKAFLQLLRLTRLLEHFEDEVVMSVAKELRVARLAAGSEITAGESCFAVVVSGSLQVSLPRKHASELNDLLSVRKEVDVTELAQVPHPPATSKDRVTTPRSGLRHHNNPRGSTCRGQSLRKHDPFVIGTSGSGRHVQAQTVAPNSKHDVPDRHTTHEKLLHAHIDKKLYGRNTVVDQVCELHVGDVFRPGDSNLIVADGSSRALKVEGGVEGALVVLLPTARFDGCVQNWSSASAKARPSHKSSMTIGEMQEQLMRMPILSGISKAGACALAHVAQEMAPASKGPDSEFVRPAFASGYSAMTEQRVIIRQNAPSRSIYLLLSGPATVVRNDDIKTEQKRATRIETASSRNVEVEQTETNSEELPPGQPDNDDIYESVRTLP